MELNNPGLAFVAGVFIVLVLWGYMENVKHKTLLQEPRRYRQRMGRSRRYLEQDGVQLAVRDLFPRRSTSTPLQTGDVYVQYAESYYPVVDWYLVYGPDGYSGKVRLRVRDYGWVTLGPTDEVWFVDKR